MNENELVYSRFELSLHFGVCEMTIHRWTRKCFLKRSRPSPKRYSAAEVFQIVEKFIGSDTADKYKKYFAETGKLYK